MYSFRWRLIILMLPKYDLMNGWKLNLPLSLSLYAFRFAFLHFQQPGKKFLPCTSFPCEMSAPIFMLQGGMWKSTWDGGIN